MTEQQVRQALRDFDLSGYISDTRANGRQAMTGSRQQAAALHDDIVELRNVERVLPRDLDDAIDLAAAALYGEAFLVRGDGVPRYEAYTNLRVLDWYLRARGREPYAEVWTRCRNAIRLLLADLLLFETRSLAQVEPWQTASIDAGAVRARVAALEDLRDHVAGFASSLPVGLIDPPRPDWFTYAADPSRALGMLNLTAFPQTREHDEYLFLRTIHISECCFRGVASAAEAAREHGKRLELVEATNCLLQAIDFAALLTPLFQAFKTMPPRHFAEFRDATGDASAIQSRSYQRMQVLTQGMDPTKAEVLAGVTDVADLASYDHPEYITLAHVVNLVKADATAAGLIDAIEQLDRELHKWRSLHYGIARNYLPQDVEGTGGTRGAPYLKPSVLRKIGTVADDSQPAEADEPDRKDGHSRGGPGRDSLGPAATDAAP